MQRKKPRVLMCGVPERWSPAEGEQAAPRSHEGGQGFCAPGTRVKESASSIRQQFTIAWSHQQHGCQLSVEFVEEGAAEV